MATSCICVSMCVDVYGTFNLRSTKTRAVEFCGHNAHHKTTSCTIFGNDLSNSKEIINILEKLRELGLVCHLA